MYKLWQPLHPGDIVDIVAPASACLDRDQAMVAIEATLKSWGLVPRIAQDMFGPDLLCANNDQQRFLSLINALTNTSSKAVWCLRGGYGCARLMAQMATIPKPIANKLFIGMSDITALHLWLQQQWGWATLHAASVHQVGTDILQPECSAEIRNIIFGQQTHSEFTNLIPLNSSARDSKILTSTITGGNLSIVQTSIGTSWQINADQKILFLEETNERGYRVDRILQHLQQAGIFKQASAIIFGDFIGGKEPDGSSLIDEVLQRFAEECKIPVLRCLGIGHDTYNRPLPLATTAVLNLGDQQTLKIATGHA